MYTTDDDGNLVDEYGKRIITLLDIFNDKNKYSTDHKVVPLWVSEGEKTGDKIPLWQALMPLFRYLADEDVSELVINKPKEVIVERRGEWETHNVEELSHSKLRSIAELTALYTTQTIDEKNPVVSSSLPTGERIQICAFSSVLSGRFSMTFRKPSNKTITLEEYAKVGYFDKVKWVSHVDMDAIRSSRLLTDEQKELALALHERRWYDFFCKSVAYHQNILLSGSTGSGKTTFMKALISRIPKDERLISIENVDEIGLYKTHNNSVPLFYSAGGRGIAEVSQKTLLVSSLRMRPDRIFLAELLEGNEAFYYLRNIGSGHPGSITTMHANTAFEAKEQLLLFIKESEAGNNLSEDSVYSFLDKKIHIILQVNRVGTKRIMTQIDYDPLRQYRVQQNVISASLERLERQVSELVEAVKHKETGRV